MPLAVGDLAPKFALVGFPEGDYDLASRLGSPVVLAFYPEDHSPVCSVQLRAYADGMDDFRSLGATVWGISPQSPKTHRSFAERYRLNFPLLSDMDKAVGQLYGILGPLGFYRRSVFVINAAGVITYCHRTTAGLTYRPTQELLAAVKEAEAGV